MSFITDLAKGADLLVFIKVGELCGVLMVDLEESQVIHSYLITFRVNLSKTVVELLREFSKLLLVLSVLHEYLVQG